MRATKVIGRTRVFGDQLLAERRALTVRFIRSERVTSSTALRGRFGHAPGSSISLLASHHQEMNQTRVLVNLATRKVVGDSLRFEQMTATTAEDRPGGLVRTSSANQRNKPSGKVSV